MIRNATINDGKKICDIYNHYVQNTAISFEKQPVSIQLKVQFIWIPDVKEKALEVNCIDL